MPLRIARPRTLQRATRTRGSTATRAEEAARASGAAAAASKVKAGRSSGADSMLATILVWAMLTLLLVRWDWIEFIGHAADSTLEVAHLRPATIMDRFLKAGWLLGGFILVMRHSAKALPLMGFVNRGYIAFLILAPLSILWSISPNDTAVRCVGIISMVMVSLAFASAGWNPRRFQQVLRPFITLVLLDSLIAGLLAPGWIVETGLLQGAWHGVFESKNMFGQVAALGVILWVHAWLYEKAKWWYVVPCLALSVCCLMFSRSSTALLAAIFACFLMVLLHRLPPYMRRYLPYIVIFFSVAVLIYLAAVLQLIPGLEILFNPIGALTGKDTTFSARSWIWQVVNEHRALSPILGSGYGAYWVGPIPTSPSFEFVGRLFFYPWESHNGYLEMANDLGYVGLAVLFTFLYLYLRQSLTVFRTERAQAVLFFAIFFEQALINLSESAWLVVNSPVSFNVVALAVFSLARLAMDQKNKVARA